MKEIQFNELKPLLKYFPIQIGETEVVFESNRYQLLHKKKRWMSLNLINLIEIKDQFIEINLANGKVVSTGLGFGLRETILSQKQNVKEIIVIEKNIDVIKMFDLFAERSNFDRSKIKIINDDAEIACDIECDWLLLDHYEPTHQVYWEIVDDVRKMARNCKAKNLFFWPFALLYYHYCNTKGLDIKEKVSYNTFVDAIKIDKLPKNVESDLLIHIPSIFKE